MENSKKATIFDMFHDGSFLSMSKSDQDVIFEIDIEYLAELIQSEYTTFSGILMKCQQYRFEPWEGGIIEEDIRVISASIKGMEIGGGEPDKEMTVVKCLGGEKRHKYIGGDFIFSCDAIEIFDQAGLPVTFEKLEELSRKSVEDVP